ncbi:hypothetical protein [Paenibacillus tyrfis]|uniref:hypothetical protein n=1 Tax=Paenibacillus tyrfis TaxID=1501230 RepID=UPI0020A0AC2A|nr:hypothetical protein [Paenibacillus tyrfis]MCP1312425.1 hypothetical protein [Paenibacillus tyrfis]
MKKWMRKYRDKGEFGLLDQRGRRERYIDQNRYVQQLKRENEMLKKCLEIWMREVWLGSLPPSRKHRNNIASVSSASCSGSPESDTTPI